MANLRKFLSQFNVVNQCRRYRLKLWQCPTFLFMVMGLIIIGVMAATYFIARLYAGPEIIILLETVITSILFIIGHLIIQGFDSLAKINVTMSEFISIASHQLRTPLTHLRWTVESLMEETSKNLEPKQLEHLSYIEDNSRRMTLLVNDLLNVSRIEGGRLFLNPAAFSISHMIDEIIKEFTTNTQAQNIKLTKQITGSIPQVYADSSKIHEVLQNLIDNAIRYTPLKGSVVVKIEQQNNFVRVSIKDQGVGIPEQDKKNIFKKFFRSQNAMKYQTEGTGLGLFIAKGIINNSKGKIGFISQQNQGSTFWFTLPLAKNIPSNNYL